MAEFKAERIRCVQILRRLARDCGEEQVSDRAARGKVEELAKKLSEHAVLGDEAKAEAKKAWKDYRKTFGEKDATDSAPEVKATWRLRGRSFLLT